MAAENYRTSPWNTSLIASSGRGGGTEVETKLALTIALDSASLGKEAAAQGISGIKGFSVSHNYHLHAETSHALRTKGKTDSV